jgi:hypothetical protein
VLRPMVIRHGDRGMPWRSGWLYCGAWPVPPMRLARYLIHSGFNASCDHHKACGVLCCLDVDNVAAECTAASKISTAVGTNPGSSPGRCAYWLPW